MKVVVTECGLVAASGQGIQAAWDRTKNGESCIKPVESLDLGQSTDLLAAECPALPNSHPDEDRAIQFLFQAAHEFSTGFREFIAKDKKRAQRTALVLGTSKGAVIRMAEVHRKKGQKLSDEDVRTINRYRPGYGTRRLADYLGILGPRSTLALACASSSMAVIHGAELIRLGVVDRAVVGGFDSLSPFVLAGFNSIGALSKTVCRPFDKRRDGTVLGEGAALLVLENEESACEREIIPVAVYEGGGCAADGVHLTAPDREGRGLARAIRQAMDQAGIQASSIGYINAHGTGTNFNDSMECAAFARLFCESETEKRPPPLSSIKGTFGHTLGAAGALDALVSILALKYQILPPTAGDGQQPEVEDWDLVFGSGCQVENLDRVLSTNSGFAGNNTALIFSRFRDFQETGRSCTHRIPEPCAPSVGLP